MVGDMMLGTDFPENRLPDDDGVGFLEAVAPILRAADLAFGNLEGVLADADTKPAKACSNPAACYLFRSPPRYAAHFAAAGFDALSVANNHARDFGEEGRSSTMAALADHGIAHSGRRGDFAILTHNGLRVAFLAFAVTQNSNLVHDYDVAYSTVAEHAQAHDLVVVSFHGGAEGGDVTRLPFAEEWHYGEPRGNVVRFARSMVDAGADLVFGHGPHVVRGMEHYRDRLIAYSLGNFATYYGISVSDLKGVAPVLVATIDQDGRFLEGRIHSTVQIRPGGPVPDPEGRALSLLERLSRQDFREPGLEFHADGRLTPVERRFLRPLPASAEETAGDP
ncbi:MAG: CapA family protein [Woeseiaceae bacterium]|nr:CapA family protein [Woeseiaceae bacterium]